jgi:hypothetical protein
MSRFIYGVVDGVDPFLSSLVPANHGGWMTENEK